MKGIGPNQGSPGPPFQSGDCEGLDDKNQAAREEVRDKLDQKSQGPGLNQEEFKTLTKADSTGMTFSSANSQVPGASGIFTGCSSGCAQACAPNSVGSGGPSEMKVGTASKVRNGDEAGRAAAREAAGSLCDKSHLNPGGGFGAHAETKIMNQMTQDFGAAAMRGGQMLFSIDWRFSREGQEKRSGMPCKHCYAMLCHAAKVCDIKIFICDAKNQPQELSKEKNCDDEDGYANLSKSIDGNIKPGRAMAL